METFKATSCRGMYFCHEFRLRGMGALARIAGRLALLDWPVIFLVILACGLRFSLAASEAGKEPSAAPSLDYREALRQDWLFQAEGEDLLARSRKELGWTREMLARLQKSSSAPTVPVLAADTDALDALEHKAAGMNAGADAAAKEALYLDIRRLKRQIMFQSPDMAFDRIVCVDAPYPRSPHESLFRGEMSAVHGAGLLVLENIKGEPTVRRLAPPPVFKKRAAMFGFDLSFDAKKIVFCMKPEDEKAFHLYEIGVDGSGFRQITSAAYSDLDPIYLPGGGYVFDSSRAEVYVNCGPWARALVTTRCDENGRNIHILSPGSEAEYTPSMLADGRILFTRWEYVDKCPNRIQSLWTMWPDGSRASTCWGNQSVWPDHLGEARQIPGTRKIIFSGLGHHHIYRSSIGIVDPSAGVNYPDGLWKVTREVCWGEVGDGPKPARTYAPDYHTAGPYTSFKYPYPLSEEHFLVSVRRGGFECSYQLMVMDMHGNREWLWRGEYNIFNARPLQPRPVPAILPSFSDLLGSEKDKPVVRPGLFYSMNIFNEAPEVLRAQGKYLRIVESMPKNYSVGFLHSGGKPFGDPGPNAAWGEWEGIMRKGGLGDSSSFAGPATSLTGVLSVKQVHGVVPIRPDGSVCFEVPPCRMLYFQVLDEKYRCIHTMRSWVSLRPGETRGCVGCHEQHNTAPAPRPYAGTLKPDPLARPEWGVRSLSYLKDIQPIFDRACAECHSGGGVAQAKLDLTLRPDPTLRTDGKRRWGGIYPEPYLTLLLGPGHQELYRKPGPYSASLLGLRDGGSGDVRLPVGCSTNFAGACDGKRGVVAVPNIWDIPYTTLPPLSFLSPKSRLVAEAMDPKRCGKHITAADLHMLITWIDLWAMFRSDEDCREIEDPPPEKFKYWAYPPKCKSAPRVRTEYSQDEYQRFEDRMDAGSQPSGHESAAK